MWGTWLIEQGGEGRRERGGGGGGGEVERGRVGGGGGVGASSWFWMRLSNVPSAKPQLDGSSGFSARVGSCGSYGSHAQSPSLLHI